MKLVLGGTANLKALMVGRKISKVQMVRNVIFLLGRTGNLKISVRNCHFYVEQKYKDNYVKCFKEG